MCYRLFYIVVCFIYYYDCFFCYVSSTVCMAIAINNLTLLMLFMGVVAFCDFLVLWCVGVAYISFQVN